MASSAAAADRAGFAQRVRLQVAARYRGADIDVDDSRFVLRVRAPGIDTVLPLGPLHQACLRRPDQSAALITSYLANLERRLTPSTSPALNTARLIWCVRARSYLRSVGRAADLLVRDVAADLVAFVAEDLPSSLMRGVPRDQWTAASLDDDAVSAAADANTAARFTALAERIRGADRVPADGWRMSAEPLFQGSLLLAPDVLRAFHDRAGGDVLLGVPDRSVVLAVPASAPGAERFERRVMREWREAMNPCWPGVLVTDGAEVRSQGGRRRRGRTMVLPWLDE